MLHERGRGVRTPVQMGIFDFLRGKSARPSSAASAMPPLMFKDGAAALEYACKYMECPLHEGTLLPALVVDPRQLFGASSAVQAQPDGNQIAMLRVASSDGGFIVFASTVGPKGPRLTPGDFVGWKAGGHSPEVTASIGAKDPRCGWVGLILGTLKTEHRNGQWIGNERFAP